MVRLKAYKGISRRNWPEFQFRNGSIKSLIHKSKITKMSMFQFRNGSIKSIDGPEAVNDR